MRLTVSFSLQEETVHRLREKLRNDTRFRNKSHLVEYAIMRCLEE